MWHVGIGDAADSSVSTGAPLLSTKDVLRDVGDRCELFAPFWMGVVSDKEGY